jgi:hypothetical protein
MKKKFDVAINTKNNDHITKLKYVSMVQVWISLRYIVHLIGMGIHNIVIMLSLYIKKSNRKSSIVKRD